MKELKKPTWSVRRERDVRCGRLIDGVLGRPQLWQDMLDANQEMRPPAYANAVMAMQNTANHLATGSSGEAYGMPKLDYYNAINERLLTHDWGVAMHGRNALDVYSDARMLISPRVDYGGMKSIFYVLRAKPLGMIKVLAQAGCEEEKNFVDGMPEFSGTERLPILDMDLGEEVRMALMTPTPAQLENMDGHGYNMSMRALKRMFVSLYGLHKEPSVDQKRDGSLSKRSWDELCMLYKNIYGWSPFIVGFGHIQCPFDVREVEVKSASHKLNDPADKISADLLPSCLRGTLSASALAIFEPGTTHYRPKLNLFQTTLKEYDRDSLLEIEAFEADVFERRLNAHNRLWLAQTRLVMGGYGSRNGG